jgi:osmoprotectant transport system ATP-binding protein
VARHTEQLPVIDENGQPLGVLHFADLVAERSEA